MDVESLLKANESDLARDKEISRILLCHEKDYYALFQINPLSPSVESADVAAQARKIFRKKSLLIHPDKSSNPDAPKAFDRLKRAQLVLSSLKESAPKEENHDPAAEHENLVQVYKTVADGLGQALVDDWNHPANAKIRDRVRLVLEKHQKDQAIEKEFLQRQELQKQAEMKTAAESRQQRKTWEALWEQDRDHRVSLWRNYLAKVDKPKRKKKKQVLA